MAKYVLLYHGGEMPATEAEGAAVMQAWMAWFGALGAAVVDGGNPFTPAAKQIAADGTVSDGAILGGYSVIQADSFDAAVELAKGCPHLKYRGQVSVHETFNVM